MIPDSRPFPQSAPYRSRPDESRGRFFAEPPSATRTAFQRDRDRIVHAAAFRRLALKTQVFLPDEGDHYRTRLTHTIEVGQITRTLTRALGLDDDLGEALALAHDLGHTPFGHTGEDALSEAMRAFGGFDHNAQTVRVVTLLEHRYPTFPGLNLSWETMEGLTARGGRLSIVADATSAWFRAGVPCLASGGWAKDFDATRHASAEAQAAALADDIAYNAHDLEDGLQAGLFGLEDLDSVPLLAATRDTLSATPGMDRDLLVRGLARELVGLFVEAAIAESRRRLDEARPESADDVRRADRSLIALSAPLAAASDAIKAFLFARMYRHPKLIDTRLRASQIVKDLAFRLLEAPNLLPAEWRSGGREEPLAHARRVTDYVAGMTDRFAMAEHRRLFDATPELR